MMQCGDARRPGVDAGQTGVRVVRTDSARTGRETSSDQRAEPDGDAAPQRRDRRRAVLHGAVEPAARAHRARPRAALVADRPALGDRHAGAAGAADQHGPLPACGLAAPPRRPARPGGRRGPARRAGAARCGRLLPRHVDHRRCLRDRHQRRGRPAVDPGLDRRAAAQHRRHPVRRVARAGHPAPAEQRLHHRERRAHRCRHARLARRHRPARAGAGVPVRQGRRPLPALVATVRRAAGRRAPVGGPRPDLGHPRRLHPGTGAGQPV